MMKSGSGSLKWMTLLSLPVMLLVSGCETNDSVKDSPSGGDRSVVRIEPSAASLETAAGQTLTLTASGGALPYRWQIANTALGNVTAFGARGVYTVSGGSGANFVVVTDAGGNSAGARIIQGDIATSTLAISPTTVNLTIDQATATFSVTGGQAPYRWSISDALLGTIQAGATSVVYFRNANAGAQFIRATDALGFTVDAMIIQEPRPLVALTATAVPSTLTQDGDKSVLTASGGTPPYTWSVTDAALGFITGNTTGISTVYTRNHNGANVVVLRDADGAVFNLPIEQP